MNQTTDANTSMDNDIEILPSKSDPLNRYCVITAKKLVEHIKPETALIFPTDKHVSENSDLGLDQLGFFLGDQGVKVLNAKTTPSSGKAESHDLVIMICSSSEKFSDIETEIDMLSKQASHIMFVLPFVDAIETFSTSAAELAGSISKHLLGKQFLRDSAFRQTPDGVLSNLYMKVGTKEVASTLENTLAGYEYDITRLVVERGRMRTADITKEIASGDSIFTDSKANDMATALASKASLIKKLEQELVEVKQNVYVARDATVGAEAEKARYKGEANEARYLAHIRQQEVQGLFEDSKGKHRLRNLYRTKLVDYKVFRLVAKLTRRIR